MPGGRLSTTLRHRWQVLGREIGAFGVVGATCFALDVALFHLLYAEVGLGAVTSKLVSTLVTMVLAFAGHRLWSFGHRARTGLTRESLLFAAVNGATLALGLAIVAVVRYPLGQDDALVLQAANVASIAIGTVARYLAYRYWVFPARPVAADRPDEQPAPAPLGLSSAATAGSARPPGGCTPAGAEIAARVTLPSQESSCTPSHGWGAGPTT